MECLLLARKTVLLSSSQCQRIGTILRQMKEEIGYFTSVGCRWNFSKHCLRNLISFHVFILLYSWTNCRHPAPKKSRLAWIKTWLQVSLIRVCVCVCVSPQSVVAEEWGSSTHLHTCGTPLKQDGSVPFFVSIFVFSLQTLLKLLSRGDDKV